MNIFVHDTFDPETTAMLQALYSRSSKSVEEHVKRARKQKASDFMASYYVGYGHASIGDCGTTTIFIENVSILAAKAIQDNTLYSGQESSSRYIDFSKQQLVNPCGSQEGENIQKEWMSFYLENYDGLVSYLAENNPAPKLENTIAWEKTVRARAFDILRGFLPAGVTTQLSWSTNLRQAADNLTRLSKHPLSEIVNISEEIGAILKTHYPSSFSQKCRPEEEEYLKAFYENESYIHPKINLDSAFQAESIIPLDLNTRVLSYLQQRPKYTNLPRSIGNVGRFRIECSLDYGSFRDLQRHRNGYTPIPLLTTSLGFNEWYLEQLPQDMRREAEHLILKQEERIANLKSTVDISEFDEQYYIPLGYDVYVELEYDLSQLIYVAELRSGSTVHPTLRSLAREMGLFIEREIPGVPFYLDYEKSDFDIRRGTQDIQELQES